MPLIRQPLAAITIPFSRAIAAPLLYARLSADIATFSPLIDAHGRLHAFAPPR